jgi:hypothetical protein
MPRPALPPGTRFIQEISVDALGVRLEEVTIIGGPTRGPDRTYYHLFQGSDRIILDHHELAPIAAALLKAAALS